MMADQCEHEEELSFCIEEEEFYIVVGRLRLAVRELFTAICEALGIDKLLRWLDALLAKGGEG